MSAFASSASVGDTGTQAIIDLNFIRFKHAVYGRTMRLYLTPP